MSMPEDREILVQLAVLHQQMMTVSSSVDELKASVREVVELDRSMNELTVVQRQMRQDIQVQWDRIDTHRTQLDAVAKRTDEWINKGRGAMATALLVGGLAQTCILGAVVYTFGHLRLAEDSVLILQQRVNQLEASK